LPVKFQSFSRKKRELELNRDFDEFIVYSNFSRTELIRNGFDPSRVHISSPIPDLGATAPISSFGPRNLIIFAGQIIRGKGVDALLRALARVRSRFECLIFGEGSHRAYCERLSRKLGLEQRVRFMGFASAAEMQSHYLDASMAVVSSLWPEPFGMVGPEAMRYGLPVVAFDAGGIREWLRDGKNGCLVRWNDQEEFARRIDCLLMDKELAKALGREGREMVRTEYHPERQLDVVESILQGQALRKQRGNDSNVSVLRNESSFAEVISTLKLL
jgi:glycosyltransferase involved in cell wall biosynthesis